MIEGIWVPLITPFRAGRIDDCSLSRLIEHLVEEGVHGLVAAATTGESALLSDSEILQVATLARRAAAAKLPVWAGVCGSSTERAVQLAKQLEGSGVDGLLVACPSYVRPSQAGLEQHFTAVAAAVRIPTLLYDIPARTGVKLATETIRRLAEVDNIVGLKDAGADSERTSVLLREPPKAFAILTGEDHRLFEVLCLGGQGGILASAHIEPAAFVRLFAAIKASDLCAARELWYALLPRITLLFAEPNPAPVKALLHLQRFISSAELRLPLVGVSENLLAELGQLRGSWVQSSDLAGFSSIPALPANP